MRKILVVLVALAVLVCVLTLSLSGQSVPSCYRYFEYVGGFPEPPHYDPFPLPAGFECGPSDGPWTQPCRVPTSACLPANGPKEICISCLTAGHPISLSTGNTYIIQTDVSIPGLGGGLRLARTWNSLLPQIQSSFSGMFGSGWRSTYEERLIFNASDKYLKWARGDGSVWSFGFVSFAPNTYRTAAPANDTTIITTDTDNTTFTIMSWTMVSKSGEKRIFHGTSGLLTKIIDRNGNTTQLTYDGSNRLTTVTDAASRHLYFNYTGSSTLVSSVTSDFGITLSYSYDGNGRLTQVTKPDNTTASFVYDANNRITSVTDNEGKVLESHTYDTLGRGLTSSRASGVDAVTVTYPQ